LFKSQFKKEFGGDISLQTTFSELKDIQKESIKEENKNARTQRRTL
jgi:hypothetical protein